MSRSDFINRQIDRTISANSPTTLMGLRGLLRFHRMPNWLAYLIIIAIVGSWLPLAGAVRARFVRSEQPPVHLFRDMDNQPKFGPQAVNPLFANTMAMRPPIPGTVARGQLKDDDHFYRGYRILDTGPDGTAEVEFFDGYPQRIEVNAQFITRGKEMYARFCSYCHGYDGWGNGTVHMRAQANPTSNPNWVPPSRLHDESIRARPDGHIYNTINVGIRTMAGYGHQIEPRDRWAIVAYLRALQLSQDADHDLLPPELLQQLEIRPTRVAGQPMGVADEEEDQDPAAPPNGANTTPTTPAGG